MPLKSALDAEWCACHKPIMNAECKRLPPRQVQTATTWYRKKPACWLVGLCLCCWAGVYANTVTDYKAFVLYAKAKF